MIKEEFDKWLKGKKLKLLPWQYDAALALLQGMERTENQLAFDVATGKTVMLETLSEFFKDKNYPSNLPHMMVLHEADRGSIWYRGAIKNRKRLLTGGK